MRAIDARALDEPIGVGDLVGMAGQVPPIDHFMGVDDLVAAFQSLASDHPDLVTTTRIGTSRGREPLWCFTVGSGVQDYVIIGGVHPNEPVGGWTSLQLASILCGHDRLRRMFDATWHIIPCIDPDGARLNEGWFRGPFDRGHYARHFYRPAPNEQVEWAFPFSYKRAYFDQVLPETLALMRLIDRTTPAFMASLHNGEFGGVYYYLSDPIPELYEPLHEIPRAVGLALDLGEPEVPYAPVLADAIFGMISMPTAYDYIEGLGLDPTPQIAGESSAAYARGHGTISLVTEVPYWTHPHSGDSTRTTESYAKVLLGQADRMRATADELKRVLDVVSCDLTVESAFLRASRAFVPMLARTADMATSRASRLDSKRIASVAERFSCNDVVHSFRLRYGGMLLRALDAQIGTGASTRVLRDEHRALSKTYGRWLDEAAAESPAQQIPIHHLVGVQLASILVTARHVRSSVDRFGRG